MTNGQTIITIEGNIGSGKTTLLSHLQERYANNSNVVFLKEPVDEWESIKDKEGNTMLQKFYADQEKYSFPFQMMAYISRLALLKEAIRLNPNETIITERSLYTDKYVFAKMLYDQEKIEDVNYQIYCKWFDSFSTECDIHKCIYVYTRPEICHERILKRSRTGEDNIPLEYLKSCDAYHNNMILDHLPISDIKNILILDGDLDVYNNPTELDDWTVKIDKILGL
jgi:deoxyadenosine/deoxycytidine kinase